VFCRSFIEPLELLGFFEDQLWCDFFLLQDGRVAEPLSLVVGKVVQVVCRVRVVRLRVVVRRGLRRKVD
jgi:hypothetical protein